eukprot:Gregarina_sp_Poly_1__44@NODE_100_length_14458_cov_232_622472_g87_i0_p6_GENE_NODE_100_length_14458_cov_232_622472_g87_i0NODE_100_length_14458_cov_232_622472_g87_i0_p6_ORF_typecomplete_len381_score49_10_NODE_100_length_14458_cov_232_622472_g87_i0966210804
MEADPEKDASDRHLESTQLPPSKPVELSREDVPPAASVPKRQTVQLPIDPISHPPCLQAHPDTTATKGDNMKLNDISTVAEEDKGRTQEKVEGSEKVEGPEKVDVHGAVGSAKLGSSWKGAPPLVDLSAPSEAPQPSAVLDGTKLILRLVRHQNFQVDQPLRIIFSSKPLRRVERSLNFTTYASDAISATVVIDTGLSSHHFVPIVPALHNGVVYTRDAVAHVVVAGAGDLKRMKISSKGLPYKIANKFVATSSFSAPQKKVMSDPYTKSALPLPWMPHVSAVGGSAAAGGVIFLRVDDSIFRYQLGRRLIGPETGDDAVEEIELQDGRVVAWSGGIEFRSTVSLWCYRRVQGASGRGSLWVDNPRQSTTPAGPPAAFAG